ncbi:MAG: hypothetical protein ACKVP0_24655 [Pirellulaceae bacterium]
MSEHLGVANAGAEDDGRSAVAQHGGQRGFVDLLQELRRQCRKGHSVFAALAQDCGERVVAFAEERMKLVDVNVNVDPLGLRDVGPTKCRRLNGTDQKRADQAAGLLP